MGVSGAGKSTVGRLLARDLGWIFEDADSFHPPANIEKMRAGIALCDEDRRAWLEALRVRARELARRGEDAVIACSALRGWFRDRLAAGHPDLIFVYLKADPRVLERRLEARGGHFMPSELLPSQFEALEEPANVLTIDASPPPEAIARAIRRELGLGGSE